MSRPNQGAGCAKLNAEQVTLIREAYRRGVPCKVIARAANMKSARSVQAIAFGDHYAWVPGAIPREESRTAMRLRDA